MSNGLLFSRLSPFGVHVQVLDIGSMHMVPKTEQQTKEMRG